MSDGNLDRIIEIRRHTAAAPDLCGAPVATWEAVATMRAQKLENSITDRKGARGDTMGNAITFRMRWLDGMTLEHCVTYEARQFKITAIQDSTNAPALTSSGP